MNCRSLSFYFLTNSHILYKSQFQQRCFCTVCALFTRRETHVTVGTNNDISLMECGRNLPTFHRISVNFYKNRWHSILQAIVIIVTTVSHKPLIFVRRQKRLHTSLLYPLELPTSLCLASLNDTELCDCEGTDEIFHVI